MSGLPVLVRPATDAGRLYPRYKNSIGILTLDSAFPRQCPHGVSIDGMLILDFDEERILAGVELIAPMSAWKGRTGVAQPLGKAGNILLAEGLTGNIDQDGPVVISKDVQRDMARISFGKSDFNRAVALSETVSALLHDDHLTGFWFRFAR
jgi:hypothetical protein